MLHFGSRSLPASSRPFVILRLTPPLLYSTPLFSPLLSFSHPIVILLASPSLFPPPLASPRLFLSLLASPRDAFSLVASPRLSLPLFAFPRLSSPLHLFPPLHASIRLFVSLRLFSCLRHSSPHSATSRRHSPFSTLFASPFVFACPCFNSPLRRSPPLLTHPSPSALNCHSSLFLNYPQFFLLYRHSFRLSVTISASPRPSISLLASPRDCVSTFLSVFFRHSSPHFVSEFTSATHRLSSPLRHSHRLSVSLRLCSPFFASSSISSPFH